jgi:hypothetical protein
MPFITHCQCKSNSFSQITRFAMFIFGVFVAVQNVKELYSSLLSLQKVSQIITGFSCLALFSKICISCDFQRFDY